MSQITGNDVQGMVSHWLRAPVNGYLGSGYGQDAKSMLQRPLIDTGADEFIAKLRADVQILDALPDGAVNLYGVPKGVDRMDIVIDVAGSSFPVVSA